MSRYIIPGQGRVDYETYIRWYYAAMPTMAVYLIRRRREGWG